MMKGSTICTLDKIVCFCGIHFYLFLHEVSILDLVVLRSILYQFVHVRVHSSFSHQNLFLVSQVKCIVTVYFVSSFITCDTSDVTASLFGLELWCSFWHFSWGVVTILDIHFPSVRLSYVSFSSHKFHSYKSTHPKWPQLYTFASTKLYPAWSPNIHFHIYQFVHKSWSLHHNCNLSYLPIRNLLCQANIYIHTYQFKYRPWIARLLLTT